MDVNDASVKHFEFMPLTGSFSMAAAAKAKHGFSEMKLK